MSGLARKSEGDLPDCFANGTASQALRTYAGAARLAVFAYDFDALQIDFEFPASEARNLGTNTTQVFGFTTSLNRVANLGLFGTNFTLAGHDPRSL
jgi:GH18 family chitinase